MSRMIDADALIKKLRFDADLRLGYGGFTYTDGVIHGLNVAISEVREAADASVKAAPADNNSTGAQEDRCPVCGAEIEYGGDQEIVDDGAVVSFSCPKCGTTGKAGYDLVFDDYYDVQKGELQWIAPTLFR